MYSVRIVAAAAALAFMTGPAFTQGTPQHEQAAEQLADPVQSKAVDDEYRGKCEAKVSKELCSCVIAVAGIHVNDLEERKVFYDYMMGDVDKAKAERALFSGEKTRSFNVNLQKADGLLGEQCEKFHEKPKAP